MAAAEESPVALAIVAATAFGRCKGDILVSYSNGYEPYILPIGFPYVTYEMFLDTLDNDTKRKLSATLKEINDEH